jgi:hypothetical protein
MGVVELVERSAATALLHAAQLQDHLRTAGPGDPAVGVCRDEVHRLVGDIVSLRNAAELLMRELPAS